MAVTWWFMPTSQCPEYTCVHVLLWVPPEAEIKIQVPAVWEVRAGYTGRRDRRHRGCY